MNSRKKGYLRAQTESIREFTVKGLEPELNRLMEKHRGDIGKQTTRWDVTIYFREIIMLEPIRVYIYTMMETSMV